MPTLALLLSLAAGARVQPPIARACLALHVDPGEPAHVTLPAYDEDPEACGSATTDGAGNVYLDTGYSLTSSAGAWLSRENLVMPLANGFVSTAQSMVPTGLNLRAPGGAVSARAPTVTYFSGAGPDARGGLMVANVACAAGSTIDLRHYDARGKLVAELHPEACLPYPTRLGPYVAVAMDARQRILLVTSGGDAWRARWFDAAGKPLTEWFASVPAPVALTPLIGGGFALGTWDKWLGTIASGAAAVGPRPAGFEDGKTAVIIKGGAGYAMVPNGAGTIDVVAPDGTACGAVASVPAGASIGVDGSLVTPAGRVSRGGDCIVKIYPQAFAAPGAPVAPRE